MFSREVYASVSEAFLKPIKLAFLYAIFLRRRFLNPSHFSAFICCKFQFYLINSVLSSFPFYFLDFFAISFALTLSFSHFLFFFLFSPDFSQKKKTNERDAYSCMYIVFRNLNNINSRKLMKLMPHALKHILCLAGRFNYLALCFHFFKHRYQLYLIHFH